MKKIILLAVFSAISLLAFTQIKMPNYFTDHAVLQRNMPINVWGWASPGEKVTVQFLNQTKSIQADSKGNWQIKLSPVKEGGPYSMTISGSNKIVLNDILMGDVWVCSGQSNMEFDMTSVANAKEEIAKANFNTIRQIRIPRNTSFDIIEDSKEANWLVCDTKNVKQFSAVAYYFARKIQAEMNVPIGLVNASWGGTNIETWTPAESLKSHPDFKKLIVSNEHQLNALFNKTANAIFDKVRNFQNDISANDVSNWKNENFDDSKWNTIHAPQLWEEQGLDGFDGVVWYRKKITLTKEQAEAANKISLSKVDDEDNTYINGKFIGRTYDYLVDRVYNLPPNIFKAGENTIAVRVFDGNGGGGIWGDDKDLKIQFNNNISPYPLAGEWKVRVDTAAVRKGIQKPNVYPGLLYNGMLRPYTKQAIKGAIWYQGEANALRAEQYRTLFPLMINAWRKEWKQGDFPFYFVQLASFDANQANGNVGSAWAELRDAQREALKLPNTGMAVASDIGDAKDIHPKNKKDVGIRLALNALKNTYGNNIVPSGPLNQSVKFANGKATIIFTNAGCGLMVRNHDFELKGFTIAGADRKFYPAKAKIIGVNTVEVFSPEVKIPVAVRYGWTDVLDQINLINKEGLPASPFRTDNWPGLTFNNKYQILE